MSALAELLAKVAADKELVADLAARVVATKQTVDDAKAKASAIGAEGVAAGLARVEAELEQVESGRTVLEGSLEKARFQVEAAITGSGLGAPGSGNERLAEHHPDGLDVMPPHERHGRNPTGEQLMGKDPSVGPFQKEHENANSDGTKSRFARLRRAAARNIEELKTGGQELVAGANSDIASFEPQDQTTYTPMTQVPDHTPQLHSPPSAQPNPTDVVGSAIVIAVVVAEGAGRLFERMRRKQHGE